jgi:hypothetical protein
MGATAPTLYWGYDPHRDEWYYCGPVPKPDVRFFAVSQEASKSLEIIATLHGLDHKAAMSEIGYPER